MNHIQDYFDNLPTIFDTPDEAVKHAFVMEQLCKSIHKLRSSVGGDMAFYTALAMDLEHWEGVTDELRKDAESTAEEMLDAKADDENYGSYDNQVRVTYREGAL